MAPSGLAILIGAGPATVGVESVSLECIVLTDPQGAGIARILADPAHGNLAVAVLARRPEALDDLVKNLRSQVPQGVFEAFPCDTSPAKLEQVFNDIKNHSSFTGLRLNTV